VSSNKSVHDEPVVGDDRVSEALASILRAALTAGRSDEELEQLSGVNHHTIKAYRLKTRKPSLAAALSIVGVLGERAVNSLLHLIRYQASPLDGAQEQPPMQIVADAFDHFNVIVQAAADNRIDHLEEPKTTEAADMLIATVLPLSSAGRAAT
jgi:hypothetical protein